MGSYYVEVFIAEKPHFADSQSQEELVDSTRQLLAAWGVVRVTQ